MRLWKDVIRAKKLHQKRHKMNAVKDLWTYERKIVNYIAGLIDFANRKVFALYIVHVVVVERIWANFIALVLLGKLAAAE